MNNENSCPDKKVMVTETRIIKQSWIIGIIGCIILVFGKTRAFSQHTDTMGQSIDTTVTGIDSLLAMEYIEFLYQKMFDDADALTDEEDHETITDDYEELLTEYEFCRLQPININSESVTRLGEMGLLTVFQIEALRQYRKWYGDLLYIEELFMVEGFDERTIAVMAPVVYCGDNERVQEQERLSLGKIITQGKHQLTLNYARKIEDSEAYSDVDDSLRITKPNTYYLGSPVKLQLKYNYRYGSKLRFGLVMGKDAGEPLFFNHFSDTIQQLVKAYRNPGFDFYGAHLYMNDLRILRDAGEGIVVRDLALGDYQLSFGQGLTLWSGMSFGKAPGGSSVIKRGAGVRPKASAGEGRFFRGLAATLTFYFLLGHYRQSA